MGAGEVSVAAALLEVIPAGFTRDVSVRHMRLPPALLAAYHPATRAICLDWYLTPHVVYHELGHHIWHYHMTPSQRRNYVAIRDACVSSRCKNTEEDFAETLASLFVAETDRGKFLPAKTKQQFIMELLWP